MPDDAFSFSPRAMWHALDERRLLLLFDGAEHLGEGHVVGEVCRQGGLRPDLTELAEGNLGRGLARVPRGDDFVRRFDEPCGDSSALATLRGERGGEGDVRLDAFGQSGGREGVFVEAVKGTNAFEEVALGLFLFTFVSERDGSGDDGVTKGTSVIVVDHFGCGMSQAVASTGDLVPLFGGLRDLFEEVNAEDGDVFVDHTICFVFVFVLFVLT